MERVHTGSAPPDATDRVGATAAALAGKVAVGTTRAGRGRRRSVITRP